MVDILALGEIKTYHPIGKVSRMVTSGMIITTQGQDVLVDVCGGSLVIEEFDYRTGGKVIIKSTKNVWVSLKRGSYKILGECIFHTGIDFECWDEWKYLEKQGLKIKEWEEMSLVQPAQSYTVLFKYSCTYYRYVIPAVEPTILLLNMSEIPVVMLRIVNNDDGSDMGAVTYPHYLFPTKVLQFLNTEWIHNHGRESHEHDLSPSNQMETPHCLGPTTSRPSHNKNVHPRYNRTIHSKQTQTSLQEHS